MVSFEKLRTRRTVSIGACAESEPFLGKREGHLPGQSLSAIGGWLRLKQFDAPCVLHGLRQRY